MTFSSRIHLDLHSKVILVEMYENFNEKEAINLTQYLNSLRNQIQYENFIFIVPKKWKSNDNSRRTLRSFFRNNSSHLVSNSAIKRAILKTEAIIHRSKVVNIYNSLDEAFRGINSQFKQYV